MSRLRLQEGIAKQRVVLLLLILLETNDMIIAGLVKFPTKRLLHNQKIEELVDTILIYTFLS